MVLCPLLSGIFQLPQLMFEPLLTQGVNMWWGRAVQVTAAFANTSALQILPVLVPTSIPSVSFLSWGKQ